MLKLFSWKAFSIYFLTHNTDGQNAIEINSKGVMLTNQHLECQNTEKCQFAEKLRLYKQLCNFRALFRPIFYFNNERKMHFLYLYANILLLYIHVQIFKNTNNYEHFRYLKYIHYVEIKFDDFFESSFE